LSWSWKRQGRRQVLGNHGWKGGDEERGGEGEQHIVLYLLSLAVLLGGCLSENAIGR